MTTIGINRGIRQLIEKASQDNESVDATLRRLMENVDESLTVEVDKSRTNIKVSEETFDMLNQHKLFSTESHISVIFRLLSENGMLE